MVISDGFTGAKEQNNLKYFAFIECILSNSPIEQSLICSKTQKSTNTPTSGLTNPKNSGLKLKRQSMIYALLQPIDHSKAQG